MTCQRLSIILLVTLISIGGTFGMNPHEVAADGLRVDKRVDSRQDRRGDRRHVGNVAGLVVDMGQHHDRDVVVEFVDFRALKVHIQIGEAVFPGKGRGELGIDRYVAVAEPGDDQRSHRHNRHGLQEDAYGEQSPAVQHR